MIRLNTHQTHHAETLDKCRTSVNTYDVLKTLVPQMQTDSHFPDTEHVICSLVCLRLNPKKSLGKVRSMMEIP